LLIQSNPQIRAADREGSAPAENEGASQTIGESDGLLKKQGAKNRRGCTGTENNQGKPVRLL